MTDSTQLHVVVPAHNEEALLPRALDALNTSAAEAGCQLSVLVVADSCTDATEATARAHGADVLPVRLGRVGAARHAGFARLRATAPQAAWLATTDADSAVPTSWCRRLFELSAEGAELIAGTVCLEPPADPQLPDTLGTRWSALYATGITPAGHRHIHGANLSFHPRTYDVLGGFAALAVHEDVDLVTRAEAAGLDVRWPLDIPVTTSRRTDGRSPGGLSDDLKELIS